MTDITDLLTTYFRAWNEPDHTAALIAQTCAPTIRYLDPRYDCRSADALAARITRGRAEAPSFTVDFASAIDGYDDTYRYAWLFVVPDMGLRIPGLDIVTRGGDGRIATLTSFFGRLADIEPARRTRAQPRWSL